MKKQFNFFKIALMGAVGISSFNLQAQCAATSNIYKFSANGKKYELVKEAKSEPDARACATQRGGYLAEINSAVEQAAVLTALQSTSAGINLANTTASDGGGASYVWLGAFNSSSDLWQWSNSYESFWQGTTPANGGHSVDGAYTHWGAAEPDNFNDSQDYLALALSAWPGGVTGEWNDLRWSNQLYYIIEYNGTLATNESQSIPKPAELYPSIVTDFLFIKKTQKIITEINITNAAGNKVKSISGICRISDRIDCLGFPNGVYFVELKYTDTTTSNHKFIKTGR